MQYSITLASALTLGTALLGATPAVAQPHGAKHHHARRGAPATKDTCTFAAGTKRGLAYDPYAPAVSCFDGTKAAQWGYNWGSLRQGLSPAIEYVPMLHSALSQYTGDFNANLPGLVSAGAKYVLGFNEPDFDAGPNAPCIDANTAASDYMNLLTPIKSAHPQVKLGAPAVTSTEAPGKGLDYLKTFLGACSACKIDFIPIHWYGQPGQCEMFKSHVAQAHALAPTMPIWITEFQVLGSPEEQAQFLQEVIPFLEHEATYVQRYSYFKVGDSLTSGSGKSAVGNTYATM